MIHNISVVIPSLGNLKNLDRLIKSIAAQNLPKNRFEVLLIINGPCIEREIKLWSEAFSEFLVVCFIPEKGVNRARNYGLQRVRYPIALFLDDDCELPNPFFLSEHLRKHWQHQESFAIGGGYLLPDHSKYFDGAYNTLQMRWFFSGVEQNGLKRTNHHLLGGNVSIKIEGLKAQNLSFDEAVAYGGSEYEFFKKAEMAGLEMLMIDLDVIHHTHESWLSLSRKIFKQGQGKAHIDKKYEAVRQIESKINYSGEHFADRLTSLFYNYVFWTGYYFFQGKYFKIIAHLARNIGSSLNARRFEFLKKISNEISKKKEKGDRF